MLLCVWGLLLLVANVHALTEGKYFDRIFIIQFENQAYEKVIKNPHFAFYAGAGRSLTSYYAVTHPSQPNYWAQASGAFYDIKDDFKHNLPHTNLVDLMEGKISWKAYEEDFPGHCKLEETIGHYYRKHNPFISFTNVHTNATRCAKIVNANELDGDLVSGRLPQYSYYTPNIKNDGHDTGLKFAGEFLHSFFSARLSKFPKGTLIVITWDEDDNYHHNHIYTVLLGSMISPGTQDDTRYDHYSLLKTVEDNWNLGDLGRNDKTAVPFKFN